MTPSIPIVVYPSKYVLTPGSLCVQLDFHSIEQILTIAWVCLATAEHVDEVECKMNPKW